MSALRRLANKTRLLTPLGTEPWLVVLDFDRTLFDTSRYYEDFLEMLAATHGTEFAAEMRASEARSEQFDPFVYLAAQNLDQGLTDAFRRFRDHKYGPGAPAANYLFSDAQTFLRELANRPGIKVCIITTGGEQSQTLKLSLCPELTHLPTQILAGSKGVRLEHDIATHAAVVVEGIQYLKVILIDDRTSVLEQVTPHPRHRLLFHILRPGAKYTQTSTKGSIHEINQLTQVLPFLV